MFCRYCQKYPNSFVTGCKTLKKESVVVHEVAATHLKASRDYEAAEKPKSQSKAGKMVTKFKEDEKWRIAALFRNAHAIGKQALSFSSMTWMTR